MDSPMRRRRARSVGGTSSNGSHHRHEVRVQELEVHPAYHLSSPERDSFQDLPEEARAEGQDRSLRDDGDPLLDTSEANVPDGGMARGAGDLTVGRESPVQPRDVDEIRADGAADPLQGLAAMAASLDRSLPPGLDGEVPPGPVEAQVTAAAAAGQGTGESYIARSLDAMGNVLSSLLGRMASLEQRSSNRSSTPTSDGLEGRLQQMSLDANPTFARGPFMGDRPLASLEKIMAGTFSSDSSETARRRADEASRVVPGTIMRPQGPPLQQDMGERWMSGAQSGMPQTSPAAGLSCEEGMQTLPPIPPSSLGYYLSPEEQVKARLQQHGGQRQDDGTLCLNPAMEASLSMGPCISMTRPGFPPSGSCPNMPSHLSSSGMAFPSAASCFSPPMVPPPPIRPCMSMSGQSMIPGGDNQGGLDLTVGYVPAYFQGAMSGAHVGMPQTSPSVPGHFQHDPRVDSEAVVLGIPTLEGQRGFVQVEGQRLPCVCFGGRLVIEMSSAEGFPRSSVGPSATPTPPPGPPPPSPPTTPKAKPQIVQYGSSSTTSMTPGGTPVPPAIPVTPDIVEEPSKLVNKLPTLASVKGTSGGDASVMAGDWLAQLAPSMASLSPGAASWWSSLLRDVMGSYTTWLESSPIVRLNIRQRVLAELPAVDQFQRVEQRAAMLLLECLPEELRSETVSARATSVKGMLFLTLCSCQPGGAGEKHHLQQFLTAPDVATSLDSGVTLARKWIRLFRRGKELHVILPDPQLLVRGLDRLISKVFTDTKVPSASTFRMAAFKLERHLDYKPTELAVIDYAQMILGELEAAVLALPPAPTPKVAAFQEMAEQDAAKGKGKSKSKSKTGAKPCWRWTDGSGCRFGLNCSFAHDPLGPGRCWVCGSSEHMKPQCPVAGATSAGPEQVQGGGGQPPNANHRDREVPDDGARAEDGNKGRKAKRKAKKDAVRKAEESGKDAEAPRETLETQAAAPATSSASSQQEFLQEATKVLKSMRLARLASDGQGRCLVDGGATTSMRKATSPGEVQGLPKRMVKLAVGETHFYVNDAGTLISVEDVAPILAMVDLMEIGCRVTWTSSEGCTVWHPRRGWLQIIMNDGCPGKSWAWSLSRRQRR